ncbi:hypothetical protein Rhopal_004799-T1 [Rhodotorula paludigena]|uniref:Uncharacterized protein n=1 Tax=Rhodotorula paludigena TaxID=86838 RepID=A0AAV5GGT1_9BASI|nr:hypothetical protein Rhopal_004799-T1 [Rhodotorula paludigena]
MPASRAASSTHSSPRTRRGSRPLPFAVAIPPPPSNFVVPAPASHPPPPPHAQPPAPHANLWDDSDAFSEARQERTAAYYRDAVCEVQSVLYGGRGRDRDEIRRVVAELYDGGATFENPLTLARGRDAISDMFALLALVPGTMYSELGDMTESRSSYDGNRLLVFTHTLHIALLPFLDSESAPAAPGGSGAGPHALRRSVSFFSLPSTPYPQTPSTTAANYDPETPSSEGPGIFSKTHPAFAARDQWPSTSLLSLLSPRALASSLTTLHLKLHTRLLFNEEGRIIAHEDLWGLKELVEGVFPIVGHLYAVNRQGLGWLAGMASRTLLGQRGPAPPPAQPQPSSALEALKGGAWKDKRAYDEEAALAAGEAAYRTPRTGAGKVLYPDSGDVRGSGGAVAGAASLMSGALGLEIGERAVATTLEDADSGAE